MANSETRDLTPEMRRDILKTYRLNPDHPSLICPRDSQVDDAAFEAWRTGMNGHIKALFPERIFQ